MAIEYLGLSSVEGPLVVLEGIQDAFYDEIVEFVVDHKTKKMGRIVELNEDKAIIQDIRRNRKYVPGQYTYKTDGTSDGGYRITGNARKNL